MLKNRNVGSTILFGIISFVFLVNASLCHAENQPINTYEQVQKRFGTSLKEGIKQLAGSEYNKQDIQITPLSGGMTSANLFVMKTNGNNYVLRTLNTKHSIELRRQEILAHKYAAQIDIAPPILFVDDDLTFIIMPFVKGHTLNLNDLKSELVIKKIGNAIAKLHKYSGDFTRRQTQVDRTKKHYERALKKQVALPTIYTKLYDDYINTGHELAKILPEQVLCHGDLNPGNILVREDGEILFIDWTSATLDNQYTDLGYFALINGLSNDQGLLLLKTYLGKEPTEEQIKKFEQAKQKTSFLTATVWFDFSESAQDKLTPFSKRVEALDSLLNTQQLKTGNDYTNNGEVVSLISGDTKKIRLYALAFLKTYINWITSQDG